MDMISMATQLGVGEVSGLACQVPIVGEFFVDYLRRHPGVMGVCHSLILEGGLEVMSVLMTISAWIVLDRDPTPHPSCNV